MPNPIFIPMEFAKNGIKNVIQKVRQSGQDAQDMTWNDGTPPITLTKLEDGGLPPKGQDYNGVLNAISSHTVFCQNGGRYKWDPQVVIEFGGYPKDAIVQSSDGTREYISLIDNNPINPDSSTTGTWSIYAGQGSVPLATSTTTGIMRVLNVLTSTDVGSALSAAMGKALKDALDSLTTVVNNKLNTSQAFGVGQTWRDVTSTRSLGATYNNTTGRPIEVQVGFPDSNNRTVNVVVQVDSLVIINNTYDSGGGFGSLQVSFTVPTNSSYRIVETVSGYNFTLWTELR